MSDLRAVLALLESVANNVVENTENRGHIQFLKQSLERSERRLKVLVDFIEKFFVQIVPDGAAGESEVTLSKFRWAAKRAWVRHEGKIKEFLEELRQTNLSITTAMTALTA